MARIIKKPVEWQTVCYKCGSTVAYSVVDICRDDLHRLHIYCPADGCGGKIRVPSNSEDRVEVQDADR